MALDVGSRLGVFEVTGRLGEGGMGVVYRATDTTLNRDVALKVLPDAFANDPERLARFEREAKVLASLNHPNIAAIYGLEKSHDTRALILELVEGPTLQDRIAKGPVPLDEALPIARQIAEALEAAHEQGIIHRDLKPANVKVKDDGTVKVLDFGLAKALEPDLSDTDAANSPTMTAAATKMGVIMGTAAYMSPEQAAGKPAVRGADIWAFGVVLWEMLTGQQLFTGESVSHVLASVLKTDPEWAALPAETPEPIRRLLRRCLEKDRRERLGDMSATRLEIKEALERDPATSTSEAGAIPSMARSRARSVTTALAALSAALAVALAASVAVRPDVESPDPAVVRFALVGDPSLRVNTGATQPFAVSREGRTIVFTAGVDSAVSQPLSAVRAVRRGVQLWVRMLDELEPRLLDGTEGGIQPAISPNGEWVAFIVANHQIRKARLTGGGATDVTSFDDVSAAITWASDDELVFELIGSNSGIHRVSANGGEPELLIPLDSAAGEMRQRRPFVFRDERLVLYASTTDDGRTSLAAFSLDDGRRSRLEVDGIQALGLIDDHLIYSRDDGALMAVPFDVRGPRTQGTPRQLSDRVLSQSTGTAVTLSESGTLVYAAQESTLSRLMLGDAAGSAEQIGDQVRAFESPRFSPDGRRIAVGIADGPDGPDLWILDRASAEATRVTRAGNARLGDWTPDGQALVYRHDDQSWMVPVDGSAEPRRLVDVDGTVGDVSLLPDGRSAVILRHPGTGPFTISGTDLVRASVDDEAEITEIVAFSASGGTLRPTEPRVSPDGRWVAFQDRNEREVHIRSLDGSGGLQVSDASGFRPVWGHDTSRLFYHTFEGVMMAELQTDPLSVRRRQRIETLPLSLGGLDGSLHDVAPDGQSLLILAPVVLGPDALVAADWDAEVRRQLRAGRE